MHTGTPQTGIAYLYNYANQPWKTQQHVREAMSRLYNATENGYPGDEDQGQTSSWYILSAIGIYSVCPGTDQYVISSPIFQKVTITLENGKKFVIQSDKNSPRNVYIQNGRLNGKLYTKHYVTYANITNGGNLHYEMGPQPALNRGVATEDKPFSLTQIN
jgi:predicted alpha-1,2-mannosidase